MEEGMYYTEYPVGEFSAVDDNSALNKSSAKVIYRESDTPDGRPYIVIREEVRTKYKGKGGYRIR